MSVAVPPGDAPSIRGVASVFTEQAGQIQTAAAQLGSVSAGINAVWRSHPSAPRAAARLAAIADLLRLWATRLDDVTDAVRRYAAALETAQLAAARVNAEPPLLSAPLPTPLSQSLPGQPVPPVTLSMSTLPPLARGAIAVANVAAFNHAMAALRAADVTTAAVLQAAVSGEGGGASGVDVRIADADQAADAGPTTLTTMLVAALSTQPPDLPAVEEAIRQLGRKQNYPAYLHAVLTGLGPQLGVLIALPADAAAGYDAGEVVGVLAVVASDLRAAGRPLPRPSEEAICARLGVSALPPPAFTGR